MYGLEKKFVKSFYLSIRRKKKKKHKKTEWLTFEQYNPKTIQFIHCYAK